MFFRKKLNSQSPSNDGHRKISHEIFVSVCVSFLSVAVVFIGVCGFLYVCGQDYQMDSLRDAYASASHRINQLEGEVVDLSVQMSEIRFPWSSQERLISSVDNAIPRDGRSVFPSPYTDCHGKDYFSAGDPTVGVRFVREDLRISFTVPYDRAWGTRDYFVLPYEENHSRTIEFGRQFICSRKREFQMVVVDPVPFEAVKKRAQESMDSDYGTENPSHTLDVRNIDGKDVVIWYEARFSDDVFIELVGEEYNYVFSRAPGGGGDVSRDTLLEVIKTAEFVK